MTQIETIRGPSGTPVLISSLKQWYWENVGETYWDERYALCISGSIVDLEESASIKVVNQRILWKPPAFSECWRAGPGYYGAYPTSRIMKLPMGRNSLVVIKYIDVDGAEQTLDDTLYRIENSDISNSLIVLKPDSEWPDTQDGEIFPIRIETDCGWPVGLTWESRAYVFGETMIPTFSKFNPMAYECTDAGTTAGTEPGLTTTIGATQVDGTVEWTCIGPTVPKSIITAIECRATTRMKQAGLFLEKEPNLNPLRMNFKEAVSRWALQW